MTHPTELAASRRIATLRLSHYARASDGALFLEDGVYFSWDTEKGGVSLDVRPELGALAHVRAAVTGAPRWLTLNFVLGEGAFSAGDVLGVVVEFEGCEGRAMQPFIRSVRDGRFEDTEFKDRIDGAEERSVQVLLHPLKASDRAAAGPAHHELVIPLPRQDFSLDLRDLRYFVLPAARGVKP